MKIKKGKIVKIFSVLVIAAAILAACGSSPNIISRDENELSQNNARPALNQENARQLPVTLETGTYIASGANLKMKIDSLVFADLTLYEGDQFFGLRGKYKINNNVFAITFSDHMMNGEDSSRKGKSYAYIIVNDTTFMGNGEMWVKN